MHNRYMINTVSAAQKIDSMDTVSAAQQKHDMGTVSTIISLVIVIMYQSLISPVI